MKEYPTAKDANTAAELTLDAYSQREDFMGLAKQAREFAANKQLPDSARFEKVAAQAEQEELNRKTLQAEGRVAEAVASIVIEKKGTEFAAKALHQAFVIAKDRRNLVDMISTGNQLLADYASSPLAKEVLPGLAEQYLRVSQLELAAQKYEEYARRYPEGQNADDLLEGLDEQHLLERQFGAWFTSRSVHGHEAAGCHLVLSPAGLNDCVHNRHLCKGNSVQPKGFGCKELTALG